MKFKLLLVFKLFEVKVLKFRKKSSFSFNFKFEKNYYLLNLWLQKMTLKLKLLNKDSSMSLTLNFRRCFIAFTSIFLILLLHSPFSTLQLVSIMNNRERHYNIFTKKVNINITESFEYTGLTWSWRQVSIISSKWGGGGSFWGWFSAVFGLSL